MQNTNNLFSKIEPPSPIARFGQDPGQALGKMINIAINILIIGAGIYTLLNLVLAGYSFLSAGGEDPKKIASAWAKIWQSLLGLTIAAGSLVLAGIFGRILFGRFDALLKPSIPTL